MLLFGFLMFFHASPVPIELRCGPAASSICVFIYVQYLYLFIDKQTAVNRMDERIIYSYI